ncbi:hypothetical protein [Photobacterium ganghwense]|uniref:hypothetical protein n=1 Tax=Photobacterium ganghwense TaxID=320778 RepID=UPI001A8C96FD|nr:hypothetical protein [Photobacterium ganghwense]QSV17130.1 hypothetical protein FH974_19525 [Photobacterium ganghwense]
MNWITQLLNSQGRRDPLGRADMESTVPRKLVEEEAFSLFGDRELATLMSRAFLYRYHKSDLEADTRQRVRDDLKSRLERAYLGYDSKAEIIEVVSQVQSKDLTVEQSIKVIENITGKRISESTYQRYRSILAIKDKISHQ